MKTALAFVLVLLAVQPADACHRFKRWKYPWPQQCGTKFVAHVAASAKPQDERVDLEITITPELLETWARQDALDKIRGELK